MLDCHTSVFLVLIFVLYIVVSAARQIRSSYFGLLHTKTSAIFHLWSLARLLFGASSIWHLFCLTPLLFGFSSILYRWTCSVSHFRCVLDCHTSVFLVLIFVLYIVVIAARQIRSLSFGLLHTKTSAILHLCYLTHLLFGAFAIWYLFCLTPLLFGFSSVLYRWTFSVWHFWRVLDCHTSVFLVLIFVLYIVVSAAR